jgi:hypothetical protein
MTDEADAMEVSEVLVPARPRRFCRVVNTHKYKSFHLGDGKKIGPGEQGRIPLAMFVKVTERCPWLQRAERGDVIK